MSDVDDARAVAREDGAARMVRVGDPLVRLFQSGFVAAIRDGILAPPRGPILADAKLKRESRRRQQELRSPIHIDCMKREEAVMPTKFIIAAVATAFAASASATPYAPYALSAAHADFGAQLDQVAERPDDIGAAALAAAELLGPHNAAQERVILPLLGLADAAVAGHAPTDSDLSGRLENLEADLSALFAGEVELVTALVELYALAEEAGQPDVLRLAERMIWHETSDVEVLYPAATLVGSALAANWSGATPADF